MMQGKESESVEESSEEQSLEGSSKSVENTSSNEHHMDYLNNIEIIKDHLRSQEEHKNKGNFIKSVTESLIHEVSFITKSQLIIISWKNYFRSCTEGKIS